MRADWVEWSVVDRHLEEAAFYFRSWARGLDAVGHTLSDLSQGWEESMLAHVDGLAVGGEPVARARLVPQLEAERAEEMPSFESVTVASLALLAQGQTAVVRAALWSTCSAVRLGAARALELQVIGAESLAPWLHAELGRVLPPARRASLLGIAAAHRIAVPDLRSALASPDAALAAAAATAARYADRGLHAPALDEALRRADPAVRDAALATALEHGSSAAWGRVRELAEDAATPQAVPMLLLALLGDRSALDVLVQHLERPSHRHAALRALAFAGRVSVVPVLLAQLASRDPLTARLAGEAISVITGWSLAELAAPPPPEVDGLPPLDEDDLDADLVPSVEDDLPLPDAAAVAALWARRGSVFHRDAFDTGARWLQGQPWTLARSVALLAEAPMYRRHAIALWLRIRTGGRARIDTRALSQAQRTALRELQPLSEAGPSFPGRLPAIPEPKPRTGTSASSPRPRERACSEPEALGTPLRGALGPVLRAQPRSSCGS